MSRKTASALAGLIVGALMIAMTAVGLRVGSLNAATARPARPVPAPIVKKVTRTITIHKKDKAGDQGASVITIVQTQYSDAGGGDMKEYGDYKNEKKHEDDEHKGEHKDDKKHDEHHPEDHDGEHDDEPPDHGGWKF
jgi:hypothetical protein